MKKILITGAGGYIGSIGTSLFLKKGYEVICVDNFSTGFKQPLEFLHKRYGENKIRIYNKDLRKGVDDILKKEMNISGVVHYAAQCFIDESFVKPHAYFDNNISGSLKLLQSMQKFGIKNIVYSSTCAVYKKTNRMPIAENATIKPLSPYGQSKYIVEEILEWYRKTLDLQYIILRYFNVTGADNNGDLGDSKNPSLALVQNAVLAALKNKPLKITYKHVSTKDGSPIRDYINVLDLNDAHINAVDYLLKESKSDIFNLGTGTGNSVLEVIKTINTVTKENIFLQKTTPRKGEYSIMIADNKKAKRILNWEPKHSLEDSVKSLQKWYKKHPNGWRSK
jgi:UDP-glucose 4-epimerase